MGYTYTFKKFCVVYLKFRFNQVFPILPGNPNCKAKATTWPCVSQWPWDREGTASVTSMCRVRARMSSLWAWKPILENRSISPRGQPQALPKQRQSSVWPAAPEELLARAERKVALGILSREAEETRCVGLEFAVPAGPLCKVGFEEPAWGPAAVAAGRTHRGARARTRVPLWP